MISITHFIQIVLGGAFLLFIPGYMLVLLFFNSINKFEKIILGIGLSICVSVFLGLVLISVKSFTKATLWGSLIVITLILLGLFVFKSKI